MAFIPEISWRTLEHHHNHDKSQDWYWTLGIITVALVILLMYFGDYLFGVVVLLGAFTMILYSQKEHEEISVSLGTRGVLIDETLFPYKTLESFWVEDEIEGEVNHLILKSKKTIMPHVIIPLADDLDPDLITEYLLQYLDEEELEESLAHRLMEYLGF